MDPGSLPSLPPFPLPSPLLTHRAPARPLAGVVLPPSLPPVVLPPLRGLPSAAWCWCSFLPASSRLLSCRGSQPRYETDTHRTSRTEHKGSSRAKVFRLSRERKEPNGERARAKESLSFRSEKSCARAGQRPPPAPVRNRPPARNSPLPKSPHACMDLTSNFQGLPATRSFSEISPEDATPSGFFLPMKLSSI